MPKLIFDNFKLTFNPQNGVFLEANIRIHVIIRNQGKGSYQHAEKLAYLKNTDPLTSEAFNVLGSSQFRKWLDLYLSIILVT